MIAYIEGRGMCDVGCGMWDVGREMWDVGRGASDYGVEVAKTLALG